MAVSGISDTRQYLTFKLGEEVFAVDVAKVREILELTPITKVPKTPEFMRGVINVRGSVVPVVDMRLKFGMPRAKETINTCIVVMEVDMDGETSVIGALADSVQEVSEFQPEHIEPPPKPVPLTRPMESSSSIKMMLGASFLALSNMSLTLDAPTPTNISMNSEPLML